jgi:hypothetical protein
MVQPNTLVLLKKYRPLIVLAGFMLLYRLILSPLIGNYSNTKAEIKNLEAKLARAIPLLGDEERVNALYDSLTEFIPVETAAKDLDWQVVSTELYRSLTTIANKYNVKITNYRPRLQKKKEIPQSEDGSLQARPAKKGKDKSLSRGTQIIDIDVDLEAELYDLVRFVYYLENSVQLMEIEQADLAAGSKKALRVNLRIKKMIF